MKMKQLALSNRKAIRAILIKMYMQKAGYKQAVGFSCGNGNAALKKIGVDVLDISNYGELRANKWWKPEEINKHFPAHFDATSGHLSVYLLNELGKLLKQYIGNLDKNSKYLVPSGSGETVVALKLAYPQIHFIAVYSKTNPSTLYEQNAPLNTVVRAMGIEMAVI